MKLNRLAKMILAGGVVGASFGGMSHGAVAQYPGYQQGGCPVLDTDAHIAEMKMGYVYAINKFRTSNALASGYVCPAINSVSFETGVKRAENCVDDNVIYRVMVYRYVGSFKYNPYPQTHMRDVQRVVERATDNCQNDFFDRYPNRVWVPTP